MYPECSVLRSCANPILSHINRLLGKNWKLTFHLIQVSAHIASTEKKNPKNPWLNLTTTLPPTHHHLCFPLSSISSIHWRFFCMSTRLRSVHQICQTNGENKSWRSVMSHSDEHWEKGGRRLWKAVRWLHHRQKGVCGGWGGMACGKIMRGRQNVGGNGVKDARRILRVWEHTVNTEGRRQIVDLDEDFQI